jgi:hypothetical protein
VVADAVRLPFRGASFDGLICVEAAFHFPSRSAFFAEALRVLRPGGVLSMSDVTVERRPRTLGDAAAGLLQLRIWGMRTRQLASAGRIAGLAEGAGFADVRVELCAARTIDPALRLGRSRLASRGGPPAGPGLGRPGGAPSGRASAGAWLHPVRPPHRPRPGRRFVGLLRSAEGRRVAQPRLLPAAGRRASRRGGCGHSLFPSRSRTSNDGCGAVAGHRRIDPPVLEAERAEVHHGLVTRFPSTCPLWSGPPPVGAPFRQGVDPSVSIGLALKHRRTGSRPRG